MQKCRSQLLQELQLRGAPREGPSSPVAPGARPARRTNSIVWVLYKSQKDDSGCPYSPSLASQSQG